MVGAAADRTGHVATGQPSPRSTDLVTIAQDNLSMKRIQIVL